MKKFLSNLLLFVLPLWSVLAFCDYIYSKEATKSNYWLIEGWYDLMHGNVCADMVIMGNSRAWVHADPIRLDSILGIETFNLGIDGSCINRQIKKYNVFRMYNKKPKIIVQNIDFSSLRYNVGYRREQFFPYFWNDAIRSEFLSSEPFSFWEKYVPMYRYYHNYEIGTLRGVLANTDRKLTKGYQGQERQWNGTSFKKVRTIKFEYNDTTLKMFDQYLAKAKSENIKVVFVYSPLYIGATKKIENKKEMYDLYKSYADKYDIPILDYTYMDLCCDTAYFYNSMHLNKAGAEIFTDSLGHDLNRLMYRLR